METNAKGDGITRFQMEMEYFLKARIHPTLEKMYGDVRYRWGDYSVCIELSDGGYKGIVINIHPSNYEVYKQERKRGDDRIYHWFGGGIKNVRGDRHCDSRDEYDRLLLQVIQPIQNLVNSMEMLGVTRQFVNEGEVKRVTGVSEKAHKELVRAVTKFADKLRDVNDCQVLMGSEHYYSLNHYTLGRTAWVSVFKDEMTTVFEYNARDNKVSIYTSDDDDGEGEVNPVWVEVAWQVLKTRGFTKYNRKRLEDSL